jgi:hypothetical protein
MSGLHPTLWHCQSPQYVAMLSTTLSTKFTAVWPCHVRQYGQVGPVSVALSYATVCRISERQCVIRWLDTMFNSVSAVWPVSLQQYVQIRAPYSEYGARYLAKTGQWGAIWPHCPTSIGHTVEMLWPQCQKFSPPWRVATRHAVAILTATMSAALTACRPHQHKCHFALCDA